jgi:formamidopyrimidine-DNA glycosylase
MPELPEVETVRRGLEQRVVGRRIDRVEVHGLRTVRRTSPQAVVDGLTGATITAAGRRGKYLLCPLDTGRLLFVHLRMTGQLVLAPAGAPRSVHTHVVLGLDGDELRFVDQRTFGEVAVVDPDNLVAEAPDIAALGVDPLVDGLDRPTLRRILLGHRRQAKALLLDQHVIAGLGNIYVDEILHSARVRPERRSDTLHGREITRLHAAVHDVLGRAVDAGGSSLGDAQYVDLMGNGGGFQVDHLVYGRGGQRCRTCSRGIVERRVVAGRSAHYCPRCQV